MKKSILLTFIFGSLTLAAANMHAQIPDKKDTEKPQTTTADAWRDALPLNQPTSTPMVVMDESVDNVEAKETPAQVEKRILGLERQLMDALKQHDVDTLKLLIGDELILAGIDIPGSQTDKERYINWAKNKFELKSYTLQNVAVRVYAKTAVVTYIYKRQASIAGASADGDFTVTDVWVQRSKRWQTVSHHISPSSKNMVP